MQVRPAGKGWKMSKGKATFVYLSPSGSTREVGRRICSWLEEWGYEAAEYDLSRCRGREGEVARGVREASLLLVGSPVYADHALDPVMALLGALPCGEGKPALAFVTYGEVSSGCSLHEMWKALHGRGYEVRGLAEVVSAHALMFRSGRPLGAGRPHAGDFALLKGWVDKVAAALQEGKRGGIDGSRVRPGLLVAALDATLSRPQFMRHFWPPIRFRAERCDSCGICRKRCPVGRLDELPRIDASKKCLYCYQCVSSCPRGAFQAPMWVASPFVRAFSLIWGLRGPHATRVYA